MTIRFAFDAAQDAFPVLLVFDGFAHDNLGFLPCESLEIRGLCQLPLDAGRTDLKRVVLAGDHVLDVQIVPTFCEISLAIAVGDPVGLVDEDPKDALFPRPEQFDLDDLDPFGLRDRSRFP